MQKVFLLAVLAVANPILPVRGVGERGILLYEELRNLTEQNLGTCFRSPSGAECTALCRRVGFRVGRCHRRECFCMGQHCLDPNTTTTTQPATHHTHPTHHSHHTHPTRHTTTTTTTTTTSRPTTMPDWPTTEPSIPTCPADIGQALCNMGCNSFCRDPPDQKGDPAGPASIPPARGQTVEDGMRPATKP